MKSKHMNKQYVKPTIKVIHLHRRTNLLQASGLIDGTPAGKPAKAPEFEDWDEF